MVDSKNVHEVEDCIDVVSGRSLSRTWCRIAPNANKQTVLQTGNNLRQRGVIARTNSTSYRWDVDSVLPGTLIPRLSRTGKSWVLISITFQDLYTHPVVTYLLALIRQTMVFCCHLFRCMPVLSVVALMSASRSMTAPPPVAVTWFSRRLWKLASSSTRSRCFLDIRPNLTAATTKHRYKHRYELNVFSLWNYSNSVICDRVTE